MWLWGKKEAAPKREDKPAGSAVDEPDPNPESKEGPERADGNEGDAENNEEEEEEGNKDDEQDVVEEGKTKDDAKQNEDNTPEEQLPPKKLPPKKLPPEEKLQGAQREATRKLQRALMRGVVKDVEKALRVATEVGVDADHLGEGEKVLMKLYARDEASKLLKDTIRRVVKAMEKLAGNLTHNYKKLSSNAMRADIKKTTLAAQHINLTTDAERVIALAEAKEVGPGEIAQAKADLQDACHRVRQTVERLIYKALNSEVVRPQLIPSSPPYFPPSHAIPSSPLPALLRPTPPIPSPIQSRHASPCPASPCSSPPHLTPPR